MPSLPAPIPFLPSGGDLAVRDTADVLATYPDQVRRSTTAPVRDALVEAETEMFLAYQRQADYAAAQSDPTRATGIYLRGLAADRGIYAQEDEDYESLRVRIYTVPDVVSAPALLAAVNAILSPYTATPAQLFESVLDRWYVGDGTTAWHSFVGDGLAEVSPQYQDRRYELRPGSEPGGAWAFAENYGRFFVMRVPDITGVTRELGYAFDGAQTAESGLGLFVTDGSDADGSAAGFIYPGMQDAVSVYQGIINAVDRLRGQGIRWMLYVDLKL